MNLLAVESLRMYSVDCRSVRFPLVFVLSASFLPLVAEPLAAETPPDPGAREYLEMAEAMEQHLFDEVLPFWFPRCVDEEHGGFLPHIRADNTLGDRLDKTIVFQSRMTWVAAEVMRRYPERADEFQPYVKHGIAFLENVMWDDQRGGFYWGLDRRGEVIPAYGTEKHLYGTAFAMYAAANAYRATKDPAALRLAQQTFRWLEQHARDRAHGGYFEAYSRRGQPLTETPRPGSDGRADTSRDLLATPYGFKSMNSHIHLLEALTELRRVWPDPVLHRRLDEVFQIVRDKIAVAPGCLNLYFTPDWRAVPDHDSFGHDIETTYLLLEAAEVLGIEGDRKTARVARSLVDHALEYGWDDAEGGFYDKGSAFFPAYGLEKVWWTQAEGLNALGLMHERFGGDTAGYWQAFCRQWEFIRRYQVHPIYGEWYATVSADGQPDDQADLANVWKAPYHNSRALMNTIERLRRMAE